jgi:hypothetical protein
MGYKNREENLAYMRRYNKLRNLKLEMELRLDPDLYAKHRESARRRQVAKTDRDIARGKRPPRKLNGGMYREKLCIRIPDWAVKGQLLCDPNSPYLYENLTTEQRAYAKQLMIERMMQR